MAIFFLQVCTHYLKGACVYGDKCRYAHERPTWAAHSAKKTQNSSYQAPRVPKPAIDSLDKVQPISQLRLGGALARKAPSKSANGTAAAVEPTLVKDIKKEEEPPVERSNSPIEDQASDSSSFDAVQLDGNNTTDTQPLPDHQQEENPNDDSGKIEKKKSSSFPIELPENPFGEEGDSTEYDARIAALTLEDDPSSGSLPRISGLSQSLDHQHSNHHHSSSWVGSIEAVQSAGHYFEEHMQHGAASLSHYSSDNNPHDNHIFGASAGTAGSGLGDYLPFRRSSIAGSIGGFSGTDHSGAVNGNGSFEAFGGYMPGEEQYGRQYAAGDGSTSNLLASVHTSVNGSYGGFSEHEVAYSPPGGPHYSGSSYQGGSYPGSTAPAGGSYGAGPSSAYPAWHIPTAAEVGAGSSVVSQNGDGDQWSAGYGSVPDNNAGYMQQYYGSNGGYNASLCQEYLATGACSKASGCNLVHGDWCEYCERYALHPNDESLRAEHAYACKARHERLAARTRSAEVECGICLERVLSKYNAAERKFGLLSCEHAFCLGCIRGWRQNYTGGADVDSALRTCPVCRITTHFITPSTVWPATKEEKDTIVDGYKAKLGSIDCRHFNFGEGTCPFGTSCMYRHVYPDGTVEEASLRKVAADEGEVRVVQPVRLSDFIVIKQGRVGRRRR